MCNSISSNDSNNILERINILRKKYGNFKILGKGWKSVVVEVNGKAFKVFKRIEDAKKEYKSLKELQGLPFVPKLYGFDEEIGAVIMEKVEGKRLGEIIEKGDIKEVKIAMKLSFLIALVLDVLGYYNPEMNNPTKHIIFGKDFPKLIDYERVKKNPKRLNLTQIVSFFFFRKEKIVRRIYGDYEKSLIVDFLKWYKRNIEEIRSKILPLF